VPIWEFRPADGTACGPLASPTASSTSHGGGQPAGRGRRREGRRVLWEARPAGRRPRRRRRAAGGSSSPSPTVASSPFSAGRPARCLWSFSAGPRSLAEPALGTRARALAIYTGAEDGRLHCLFRGGGGLPALDLRQRRRSTPGRGARPLGLLRQRRRVLLRLERETGRLAWRRPPAAGRSFLGDAPSNGPSSSAPGRAPSTRWTTRRRTAGASP